MNAVRKHSRSFFLRPEACSCETVRIPELCEQHSLRPDQVLRKPMHSAKRQLSAG